MMVALSRDIANDLLTIDSCRFEVKRFIKIIDLQSDAKKLSLSFICIKIQTII